MIVSFREYNPFPGVVKVWFLVAEDILCGVVLAWDAGRGERRWEFASREPRGARGREVDLLGVSMVIVNSYYKRSRWESWDVVLVNWESCCRWWLNALY